MLSLEATCGRALREDLHLSRPLRWRNLLCFIPTEVVVVRAMGGIFWLDVPVTEEEVFRARNWAIERFNHEGEVARHSTGLDRSSSCFGASNGGRTVE